MRKEKRNNKGLKVLFLLLIIACGAAGSLGYLYMKQYEKKTDPKRLFGKYIECLKQSDYKGMYMYLSEHSKEKITEEAFIKRNKNIYEGMEVTDIEVKVLPSEFKKLENEEVTYEMKFKTCAGAVAFKQTATFVKESKDYGLEWNDSLILPNLTVNDKVRVVTLKASRGRILDRNGNELAVQGKASSVGLVPGRMNKKNKKDLKKLAKLLDVSVETIEKKLRASWVKEDSLVPIKTIDKVDEGNLLLSHPDKENEKNSERQAEMLEIPGVSIEDVSVRRYPYRQITSHLIGYVQKVTADDIKTHANEGYTEESVIGRSGVEAAYEKQLKGRTGCEIKIVDEKGKKKDVVAMTSRKDGADVQLTIDVELQTSLYDRYQKDKSCSVAMNPNTGEVLALVSTPTFDANEFILGMSEQRWKELNSDKAKPMYNRFKQSLCPGSSLKPVIASIGVETNSIDPNKDFKSEGTSWQKDSSWGKYYITTLHTFTPVTMRNALIYSDNIYFAKAALEIGKKKLQSQFDNIGFGKSFPFELALTPSQYSNEKGINGEVQLADSGYGQGEMLVNPVHMASIYSAIINEGDMIQPYLLYKKDAGNKPYKRKAFSKQTAAVVKEALEAVVNDPHGTAYDAHRSDITLAGKTGTAEIKQSKDDKKGTELGWFNVMTTDKNMKKPILLVTMVEDVKGRGGSSYVVNNSSKILKDYLK